MCQKPTLDQSSVCTLGHVSDVTPLASTACTGGPHRPRGSSHFAPSSRFLFFSWSSSSLACPFAFHGLPASSAVTTPPCRHSSQDRLLNRAPCFITQNHIISMCSGTRREQIERVSLVLMTSLLRLLMLDTADYHLLSENAKSSLTRQDDWIENCLKRKEYLSRNLSLKASWTFSQVGNRDWFHFVLFGVPDFLYSQV